MRPATRPSAALAERHDRDDLLAGVDLTEQDDLVADVLMDMARTETAPRTDRLAEPLAAAIQARGLEDAPPSAPAGGLFGAEIARHSVGPARTGVPVLARATWRG